MSKPRKYVKIPVTVEAMQWTRDTPFQELKDFTNNLVRQDGKTDDHYVYDRLHDTWIQFQYGDWIIKGIKGEFYPCVDETFQGSYRPEVSAADEPVYAVNAHGNLEVFEQKPKKGIPRKGSAEITIHPYPAPAPVSGTVMAALMDRERRRGVLR